MHVTRMKEDFNAITYEIFKRKGIVLKLKIKLYNEYQTDSGLQEDYYHKEYIYNKGNKRSATISLSIKSYIQIDTFQNSESKKELFFMGEAMKNKFVRKLSKIVAILEAYDDKEIDIITVDSSGTHINGKLPKSEKIIMGRSIINVLLCVREEKCDVGVKLQFDNNSPVIISSDDFLELYHNLKNLNYTECAIGLLNYIGSPELGKYETDFRQPGIFETNFQDIPETKQKKSINTMSEFSEIKDSQTLTKSNGKINW